MHLKYFNTINGMRIEPLRLHACLKVLPLYDFHINVRFWGLISSAQTRARFDPKGIREYHLRPHALVSACITRIVVARALRLGAFLYKLLVDLLNDVIKVLFVKETIYDGLIHNFDAILQSLTIRQL